MAFERYIRLIMNYLIEINLYIWSTIRNARKLYQL
jgi:hypothetical protein